MNKSAIIVTTISCFLYLPVNSVIRTYVIAPRPIPFEIEYVSGIIRNVTNAGTAERISSISTFAKFLAISTPTKISAGAVAHDGMMLATGLRNRHTAKQSAVTKLVRPVLPPAAIPEADSTNVVHVHVPRIAPDSVPIESHIIHSSSFIGSPFSSSILAWEAAP